MERDANTGSELLKEVDALQRKLVGPMIIELQQAEDRLSARNGMSATDS